MIKSEIDQLIELYEIEKKNLEIFIKECLPEWDFLVAHYYSQALQDVNKILYNLYKLNDPLFTEKQSLTGTRNYYTGLLSKENDSRLNKYYKDRIEEIDHQLDELNKGKPKRSVDGQEFDDAIYDLVEGRVARFRFHLKKESNFYLEFTLRKQDALIISFTPVDQVTDQYIFTGSRLRSLTGLGFSLNTDSNCWENMIGLKTFSNSIPIKILVSRIIFDTYYHRDFDSPALIEFF